MKSLVAVAWNDICRYDESFELFKENTLKIVNSKKAISVLLNFDNKDWIKELRFSYNNNVKTY